MASSIPVHPETLKQLIQKTNQIVVLDLGGVEVETKHFGSYFNPSMRATVGAALAKNKTLRFFSIANARRARARWDHPRQHFTRISLAFACAC